MSMTESPRVTLARKIARMLAMAEGAEKIGSLAEAEAFAAKAQELMIRHELSLSDVEQAELASGDPMGMTRVSYAGTHPPLHARARRAWQEDLAAHLANHFGCSFLVYPGSTDYALIGRLSHRRLAEALITRLCLECFRLARAARPPRGSRISTRDYRGSFRRGFITAIAHRLQEERARQEAEIRALHSPAKGAALVRRLSDILDRALQWQNQELNVTSASTLRGDRVRDSDAFRRGHRAGSEASLAPPVGEGGGGGRALPEDAA
jgi:hypothetical protein